MKLILVAQIAATWTMVGLIWFVQVVHYPLMSSVGAAQFAAYEARHTRRTTWIVAPTMLVELGTALAMVLRPPASVAAISVWAGFALLGVIWLSTATLQVPAHRRLERGFDAAVHRRLVATNWIRTACWTARGLLVLTWVG